MIKNIILLAKKPAVLSLISVVLLSLPWFGCGGYFSLVGFVPMLLLRERLQESGKSGFLWWMVGVLVLWHAITCYWVSVATLVAAPGMPIGCMILLIPSWVAFHFIAKRGTKTLAYTTLIAGWVVCEWWCGSGDVNFPWLTLGNAWAESTYAVQWYSILGASGGTLWIMLSNVLVYEALRRRWMIVIAMVVIGAPIVLSVRMYNNYTEPQEKLQAAVIQPNIDAYQKFTVMNPWAQTQNILNLASKAPRCTKLYVAPETAIVRSIDHNAIQRNPDVVAIQCFLRGLNTDAKFIIGASTHNSQNQQHYNSALIIDTAEVRMYHKRKLVVAVEFTPLWLQKIIGMVDLGGFVGSLTKGEGAEVYEIDETSVGAAICYESIYPETFREWSAMGAGVMAIITNDGWWGDTHGYHHHLNYARLRAIENRKAIARSANTGISALINPRGDVVDSLGWDIRGIITGEVSINNNRTFFSVWGDVTTRLCGFIFALCVLFALSKHYRRKNQLG